MPGNGTTPSIHQRKHGDADHAGRTLAHAFSGSPLRVIEHCVTSNVEIFWGQLPLDVGQQEGGWGKPRNMSSMANYLKFDILPGLFFGKGSFGMLTQPDHRYIVDLIFHTAWRCTICGTLPIIHNSRLDKLLVPGLGRDRNRFMAFSKAQALQRTRQGEDGDRKDFFTHLLHAKDAKTGDGFTMGELWAESNLLLIAGSDIPATAIAGIFYYLTHHPRALRKLENEVHSTFNSVDEIDDHSSTKLATCAYLGACIDETMRMSPSVTGTVPREVLPGGLIVGGELVPAGTVVGTGFYSIHHRPAYFAEPFRSRPERWIVGSNAGVTRESVELAQSGFFPFSFGP